MTLGLSSEGKLYIFNRHQSTRRLVQINCFSKTNVRSHNRVENIQEQKTFILRCSGKSRPLRHGTFEILTKTAQNGVDENPRRF